MGNCVEGRKYVQLFHCEASAAAGKEMLEQETSVFRLSSWTVTIYKKFFCVGRPQSRREAACLHTLSLHALFDPLTRRLFSTVVWFLWRLQINYDLRETTVLLRPTPLSSARLPEAQPQRSTRPFLVDQILKRNTCR